MCITLSIIKRELTSYFQTPVAYVFGSVFLILIGALTFYLSNFFTRGIADLQPFFAWQPWLYLFLIPALTMRLWAEEQKSGTIEFIITLPISFWQLILGKFFASWIFVGFIIICTTPLWITVNYLGNPDNGVILASYIGSLLMAGGYIAIGSAASTLTRNQIIAFILGCIICFLFVMSGYSVVSSFFANFLPENIIQIISSLSFLSNFEAITKGRLELSNIVFFVSVIIFWLIVTKIILQHKISDGV
jgi:ABC-2 type transport system permease protein